MVRLKKPIQRICSICKNNFQAFFGNQKYCSEECASKGKRQKAREAYKRNPEKAISLVKQSYRKYHKKYLIKARTRHRKLKLIALQKVSNSLTPKCFKCNCDNLAILELAHISHNGNSEGKIRTNLLEAVARGKRSIEGLKVLCKLCNHLEDIEYRFGETGYQIIWAPS